MFQQECERIFDILTMGLPPVWDGRECIRYMKDNNCTQWRQMEWPGFYFQFMCENLLSQRGFMQIPGPRYGNVEFDAFRIIPWDFKTHCIDPRKPDNGKVPTNGYDESLKAIKEYGTIGFIILTGDADFDDQNQSFKKWHDQLKGGTSQYELERIERGAGSRRRKVRLVPRDLFFVFLDDDNIDSCGKFQENFRNSNGKARNAKVMLDLKRNRQLKTYRFRF